MMEDETDTKNYVVIGAGGSVGRALCGRLAAGGHRVLAGLRSAEAGAELNELKSAQCCSVDAEDWDSVEALLVEAQQSFGRIDGLAVCVGSILLKPAHLTTKSDFDAVLSKNLSSAFAAVRSGAKRMLKSGGSIVLVSSAAARHGFPNHEAIAAAKAGVIGLTLAAAASYAGYGIRVNCVAPGLVRSQMAASIVGNEMALKASQAMHALGRIGEPGEVASAIAWLLDAEQNWVTGQVIGVDGGLSSVLSRKR